MTMNALHITNPVENLSGATLRHLFPIPFLSYDWPDSAALNADLARVVLARQAASPGVRVSNEGGWHSDWAFDAWGGEPAAVLLRRVRRLAQEAVRRTTERLQPSHLDDWHVVAWANVNRRGHFSRSHDHVLGNNSWSGIYYVETGLAPGDDPQGGRTVFEDRVGAPRNVLDGGDPYDREFKVVPRPGLMCLFPSTLRHRVEPHAGSAPRITIAFNLSNAAFTIPTYTETAAGPAWKAFLWENFRGPMKLASRAKQILG